MDCGPACLRMIASFHGKEYTLQDLRNRSYIDKEGVSLQGISEAAESIGYRTLGVKIPFADKPDLPPLVKPLCQSLSTGTRTILWSYIGFQKNTSG